MELIEIGGGPVPVACTLEPSELPDRLAQWRAVADGAEAHHVQPDGSVRLELGPDADLPRLATLVAAERSCCAFLDFTITVDSSGVALEVRAPGGGSDVLLAFLSPAEADG